MTTPPLDLTALRIDTVTASRFEIDSSSHPWSLVDPEHLVEAIDRAEAAEKKVTAVRELHALDTHVCECGDTHGPYCKTCQYDYPCPTITALDNPETETTP